MQLIGRKKVALLVTKPEKAQLIHPPITIMGSTLVRLPFIISVNMLVSARGHLLQRDIIKSTKQLNALYAPEDPTCHGIFGNHLSFGLLEESTLGVVEIVFSHGKRLQQNRSH